MFKKLSKIFNALKWWETAFLLASFSLIIIFGVLFKSNILSILFSVTNVIVIFASGKGWFWGNAIGVFASALYIYISLASRLYGEIIMTAAFGIPAYILSFYSWFRHRQSKAIVKVNKISLKEWICAIACISLLGVGFYFLLGYFNTAFLVVSTISTTICTLARYMQVRRSEYNFLCYIFVNLVGTVLWICVTISDITNITLAVTYAIQAILNTIAFVNWIKLKYLQKQTDSFEIIKKCCLEDIK